MSQSERQISPPQITGSFRAFFFGAALPDKMEVELNYQARAVGNSDELIVAEMMEEKREHQGDLHQARMISEVTMANLAARVWEAVHLDGFSGFMRDAITAAGLPLSCKPHGLRKTFGRRLADAGVSAHDIMAALGHTALSEAGRYTREADRRRGGPAQRRRWMTISRTEIPKPRPWFGESSNASVGF